MARTTNWNRRASPRARCALADADCRILLIDVSQPPHADDLRLISDWPDALIVANKSDLPDVWGTQVPSRAMRVSALLTNGPARIVRRNRSAARAACSVDRSGDATHGASSCGELNALRDAVLNDDRSGLKSTLQALAGPHADGSTRPQARQRVIPPEFRPQRPSTLWVPNSCEFSYCDVTHLKGRLYRPARS